MTEMLAGKKILFVITKSNWGGAQAYVYTLATSAKDGGANVVVATGGTGLPNAPTGLLASHLKEAGVRIIFVSAFMRDISLFKEILAFFELLKLLKRERPDVLHLNSSKAAGLGALAGRIAGIPKIIFTAHGWPHNESRAWWQRLLIWKISWLTVLLSNTTIVLSRSEYTAAPALFLKNKLCLVRNGMAPFTTLPREVARQKIRPSGDSAAPSVAGTFLFFIIAELHKNKCIDIALRAFALVHKKHPNACLVSMGGGEEDKKLRSLAEKLGLANSVTFAGFVPDARIYLSAADCFVLPSCKEGVPLSLLQAGIAHVPAIATNVGGIPEVIENEKTGILVAPRNVKELAGAMEEMMAHPEKRISYGEALYDRVTKDFSEGEMVRKTFECY